MVRGEAVRLAARLRRTSARGWGPWTEVTLQLGPMLNGEARWLTDDPVGVGLPSTYGTVDEAFPAVDDAWARDIRFRTEAFWGMDGEILVLRSEPATMELALPPTLSGPVLDRLRTQLGLDPTI